MSEKRYKRFYVSESENQLTIYDNEGLDDYYHLGNDERDVKGICKLLNEQQATIIKQDEEIKKLKRTERSWRRIHCCNKESDNCGIVIEQQATIQSLKEENIELKKLRKYCAEWMGVKEENLYDVVR